MSADYDTSTETPCEVETDLEGWLDGADEKRQEKLRDALRGTSWGDTLTGSRGLDAVLLAFMAWLGLGLLLGCAYIAWCVLRWLVLR